MFSIFLAEPFLMSVAAGPFTTSDSLLYEPLADLMQKVQNDKPNLLILVSLMIKQMENLVNLNHLLEATTCPQQPVFRNTKIFQVN